MSEKVIKCEHCEEEPATILCSECFKCYCSECSEFTHKKGFKRDHNTEAIPEGVPVKTTCPLHKDALRLFCVDETKLCCFGCAYKELHKGHKIVEISEIVQDNEIFSAAEIKKRCEGVVGRGAALSKKIEDKTESIEKEVEKARKKIKTVFEEEHQKLIDEEDGLMKELEMARDEAIDVLQEFKSAINNACECSSVLSDADKNSDECSRLIELNIIEEMENQRREAEKLFKTKMRVLKIELDRETRKLSFKNCLFNGAPNIRNVVVKAVSWSEMEVSWEIDCEEDFDEEIKYSVEMKKGGENDWKEVMNKLVSRKCRVGGLMDNSVYDVRVKCVAIGGSLVEEWSGVVRGRTQKIPAPSNIVVKSTAWDSINIAWNAVGGSPSYQVEVDGKVQEEKIKSSPFKKKGLLPESEHSFRLRTVKDNSVSEWSGVVRGKTQKIPAPSNIVAKSTTWDSITLTWNAVGGASFYLIEVDGSKSPSASPGNSFTKRGLLPDSEHSFRVRTMYGNSASEWSGVVRGKTQKIPVPSNIAAKSTTWDSITLTWGKVKDASAYQIEVDGNKLLYTSLGCTFTKAGLLMGTEHRFRVRSVRGNSVSDWSDAVVKKTLSGPDFSSCVWKGCPNEPKRYIVDEMNPKIATKVIDPNHWCTIIGNVPIPLNKVTSWNVKIIESLNNDGGLIFIGVAPSDINQNADDEDVYYKCGWYFYCWESNLLSGPPHNYRKEYGQRKEDGQYVHTGDSVGVVMDTAKGELSFILDGVNHGVAYEGIPLDKPLVPCVLLRKYGDSVELII